jgi:hypothetical protein
MMYDIPCQFTDQPRGRVHEEAPAGRPTLPAAYAKLIVEKPLRLKLVKVTDVTENNGPVTDMTTWKGTLHFEGGKDQSVFVGMEVPYSVGSAIGTITVTNVEATSCVADLLMFGTVGKATPAPLPGYQINLPGAAPDAPAGKVVEPEKKAETK